MHINVNLRQSRWPKGPEYMRRGRVRTKRAVASAALRLVLPPGVVLLAVSPTSLVLLGHIAVGKAIGL